MDYHRYIPKTMSTSKTKLYVGHLPLRCRSIDLRSLFERYGIVTECNVVHTYGFVRMSNEYEAKLVIKILNHSKFMGSTISVQPSRSQTDWQSGTSGGSKSRSSGQYRYDSRPRYIQSHANGCDSRYYQSSFSSFPSVPAQPQPTRMHGNFYSKPSARYNDSYARVRDPYPRHVDHNARSAYYLDPRDLYERLAALKRSGWSYSRKSPSSTSPFSRKPFRSTIPPARRPAMPPPRRRQLVNIPVTGT